MTKLHEILAVEKSTTNQASTLIEDAKNKFKKASDYFTGYIKSLKLINDSPEKDAIEAAALDTKALPTTVQETLEYVMKFWIKSEDIKLQKSVTNQLAKGDIILSDGTTIATNVPVDFLLGLESRLTDLRNLGHAIPTNSAATVWDASGDGRKGSWTAHTPEVTTKTDKRIEPFVKYEATDKHPAQVDLMSKDVVIGSFTTIRFSGAATSEQKALFIERLDDLINAVTQARMRANSTEVVIANIGTKISSFLMDAFK